MVETMVGGRGREVAGFGAVGLRRGGGGADRAGGGGRGGGRTR